MPTDSDILEPLSEPIQGWAKITAYVARRTGMRVSLDTVRRWSMEADDPLPVRRWGYGKRPRILADARELDRWIDRQWQAIKGKSL